MFDEYAYVLSIKGNNAIVIGAKYLTTLEVILRKGCEETNVGELLYIGKDKREKVYSIRKKSTESELAKVEELDFLNILETIIKENESYYLNFINNAKPLSLKRHQLQLLPNAGDKNFQKIISERENKLFDSLADFESRTEFNIVKSIAKRIHLELTDPDKYFFFVRKPRIKGDIDISPSREK